MERMKFVDGKLISYDAADYLMYEADLANRGQVRAAQAREKRDAELAATDWTQMPDVPQATKDKWAPYRQALRDVPQQAGFPDNIQWPSKPE